MDGDPRDQRRQSPQGPGVRLRSTGRPAHPGEPSQASLRGTESPPAGQSFANKRPGLLHLLELPSKLTLDEPLSLSPRCPRTAATTAHLDVGSHSPESGPSQAWSVLVAQGAEARASLLLV